MPDAHPTPPRATGQPPDRTTDPTANPTTAPTPVPPQPRARHPVLAALLRSVLLASGLVLAVLAIRALAPGLLARTPNAAALDRLLAEHPFSAILTLRLLPVGSSLLLSLAAGLSGVPVLAFLGASALGALPQTVVFTLLGSGVGLGRTARIVLAAVLFLASACLGVWLMRRSRAAALQHAPAPEHAPAPAAAPERPVA